MSPSGQNLFNMLLGKSREIAPERMKMLLMPSGISRNDTEVWRWGGSLWTFILEWALPTVLTQFLTLMFCK